MNKLETIWDFSPNGGQSLVQKFGEKCIKIYPKIFVDKYTLLQYQLFQNTLETYTFPIENFELKKYGFYMIVLDFIQLKSEIYDSCIVGRQPEIKDSFCCEEKYIEGQTLGELEYGDKLIEEIRDYFRYNLESPLQFFYQSFYSSNFKLHSFRENTLYITCTDCFGDISGDVARLLSL